MHPRDRFDPFPQNPPGLTVYTDEEEYDPPKPVLYGPKGEPLYRPRPPKRPFGYRIER